MLSQVTKIADLHEVDLIVVVILYI